MRWLLLLNLLACGDDRTDVQDLAVADLPVLCPGLDRSSQTGACDRAAGGNGWLGGFCYPDSLTYCACVAMQWKCCRGDAPPKCPDTAPSSGDYCCPGAPPSALSCDYGSDGGPAVQCSCGASLSFDCH